MLLKVSIRDEFDSHVLSRAVRRRKTQNVGLIPQSNTFSYLVQSEIVELISFNLIFQFIFGKCNISTTYLLILTYSLFGVSRLQVKVFAWSPFGNQLFWFRETFLQIKSPAPKFQAPWRPIWSQLGELFLQLYTFLFYQF